jgi:hypothetical protein
MAATNVQPGDPQPKAPPRASGPVARSQGGRAECSAAIKPPSSAASRIFRRMVNQRSVHSTHADVQRPCARPSGIMPRQQRKPEFNGADRIDGFWSTHHPRAPMARFLARVNGDRADNGSHSPGTSSVVAPRQQPAARKLTPTPGARPTIRRMAAKRINELIEPMMLGRHARQRRAVARRVMAVSPSSHSRGSSARVARPHWQEPPPPKA